MRPFPRIGSVAMLALVAMTIATSSGAQAPGASISGFVVDSIHHRPLAGATVIATPMSVTRDSVMHDVITDSAGRFRLSALIAGRYVLTVEHPWSDSTGIGVPPVEVTVADNATATTALGIPSAETLRRFFCPAAMIDTTLGVILGVVRRSDGTVAARANVAFSWGDFEIDRTTARATTRQVNESVSADANGIYRACGVPIARSVFIQAQLLPGEQTGIIEEQVGEAGLLVRDFHLGARAVAVAGSTGARNDAALSAQFFLTGRVQSTEGQPISSAQVKVIGTSHLALSSDSGEFRLAGLPGGTQGIEVLALGYYPRRLRVEVGDANAPMMIPLERTAVVLDSVRVVAERVHGSPLQYREFDERRKNGMGHYITEQEIDHARPFQTTDLFHAVPGYAVNPAVSPSDEIILSTHGTDGRPCAMQVFIDGSEAQPSDANGVPPSSIHGIEVYQVAEAPIKYHVRGCGIVLIWTK
jgi:hypothetical protein